MAAHDLRAFALIFDCEGELDLRRDVGAVDGSDKDKRSFLARDVGWLALNPGRTLPLPFPVDDRPDDSA